MERRLEDPFQPISQHYLTSLSLTAFNIEHPEPLSPFEPGNLEQLRLRRQEIERRQEVYQGLVERYVRRLDTALRTKERETRTRSLRTLFVAAQGKPELQRAGLGAQLVDEGHPGIAADAAKALAGWGSPPVEARLWSRLRHWHEEWDPRREELEYALAESDSRALSQSWLERELLLALARGTNWLCGPDKLDQLLKLCVTDSGCSEVNALRRQWREQLELWVHPSGEGWGIRVGHYTLGSLAEGKRKLSLFPNGTVFLWKFQGKSAAEEERLFRDLQSFLERRATQLHR